MSAAGAAPGQRLRTFARMRRAAGLCAVFAALCLADVRAAEAPDSAPVTRIDGSAYVGANDLARLIDATKFWRSDVRKLVLRSGDHRFQFTVDHPFVLLDDRTVWLPVPVRSVRGELQIPVALLDSLPHDSTLGRLVFDPRGDGLVVALPTGGVVRSPALSATGAGMRLTFPVERVADAEVIGRAREHFRIRLAGFFIGVLPEIATTSGLVRSIRTLPSASGSAFEIELAPEAGGFRLQREESRVTLEIVRAAGPGFEEFAPEGPPGPRDLHVIVLDPGHGGDDQGVTAGGVVEKTLTLDLARMLKQVLEKRGRVRVVLTRDHDMNLTVDERAEAANRARADLVLALHFDGYAGPGARGVTAWCAPAVVGESAESARPGLSLPVEVVSWRDVALRYAVPSRSLAEHCAPRWSSRAPGPCGCASDCRIRCSASARRG
jgi:N-acetylmuramoyl-L-alanine amidase